MIHMIWSTLSSDAPMVATGTTPPSRNMSVEADPDILRVGGSHQALLIKMLMTHPHETPLGTGAYPGTDTVSALPH
jgi:hypothetical protein